MNFASSNSIPTVQLESGLTAQYQCSKEQYDATTHYSMLREKYGLPAMECPEESEYPMRLSVHNQIMDWYREWR